MPSEPSTSSGKKRLAYETASKGATASKRPLHLKKPAIKTPAQAMMDRYQKIQVG